jgi:hypothetical protein
LQVVQVQSAQTQEAQVSLQPAHWQVVCRHVAQVHAASWQVTHCPAQLPHAQAVQAS